ncbi:MAG: hypothetical protein V1932_06805 [Chloroflexota bacterium]
MAVFVQLCTFSSAGKFDEKKDTHKINEVLTKLQNNGAKIMSITPSMGSMGMGTLGSNIAAVYVITYEASAPIAA